MDINDNLNNLMKEAQKMQKRMQDAQKELVDLQVQGESGGGMVKVTMNGRHDVIKVNISSAILTDLDEPDMLEDLIAAAVNDAVRKVEKASRDKIKELTAGLNIPTDFMQEKKEEDE